MQFHIVHEPIKVVDTPQHLFTYNKNPHRLRRNSKHRYKLVERLFLCKNFRRGLTGARSSLLVE